MHSLYLRDTDKGGEEESEEEVESEKGKERMGKREKGK